MAIVTRAQLKLRLSIPASDTSEDDALDALIPQAQALVEASIGWPLEQETRDFHLPGTGREFLVLPRKPIAFVQPTANTTASSTTISGISSTALLVAGMPVVAPDVIPDGTTLASVNAGASTAVLSAAAVATSTGTRISCGCAAWLDTNAEAGQGPDDFDDGTALEPGVDFSVKPSSSGMAPHAGLYMSGMLRRVAGVWPRYASREPGWLTSNVPGPVSGDPIVKVRATCGFPASLIPADLQLAVLDVCVLAHKGAQGSILSSESFDGYSYSRDSGRLMEAYHGWLAGPGGAILSKYRRSPI